MEISIFFENYLVQDVWIEVIKMTDRRQEIYIYTINENTWNYVFLQWTFHKTKSLEKMAETYILLSLL
jgi:hypothetical protein